MKRHSHQNRSFQRGFCLRMLSPVQVKFQSVNMFLSKLWAYISFVLGRQWRGIVQYQPVKYEQFVLSPISRARLSLVPRKFLILDLDETLIHSEQITSPLQTVGKTGAPHDFTVNVVIDRCPVRFFVYKRPHLDFFLDVVSQWYELVIFTASLEIYGASVLDKLERHRNSKILHRRLFRQHCRSDAGTFTKDLTIVCPDLSRVIIVDNSPNVYRDFRENAVPIKSWLYDPTDTALLALLPMLDALRFTNNVQSVLSRNLHLHNLW